MTSTTGIFDYEVNEDTHDLFDVTLDSNQIQTLVTHTPHLVESWLDDIYRIHRRRLHRLIVGLDVEWRPNNRHFENPAATLQLCVGRRCLVFQLIYASYFPDSLIDFLGDERFTFVGVGIASDVEKLLEDYGLKVANVVDLRSLAVEMGNRDLRNAGLKGLARAVLGMEIHKPRSVTLSRWDREWLTYEQVQYACIDAFLSFEIGRCLNAAG
ncbi:3'-5' exonuclease-like [Fagus crenata]